MKTILDFGSFFFKNSLLENKQIEDLNLTYFETAQGSKYIRTPDGRLRRWKSHHSNTGGEDVGLHTWSSQSFFVDPEFQYEANSIQYLIGKGHKVALSRAKSGEIVVMIPENNKWRIANWEDAYSSYVRSNPDKEGKPLAWKYSKTPILGYHVVDFDTKEGSTILKGYHFGSPVSKIEEKLPEDAVLLFFPQASREIKESQSLNLKAGKVYPEVEIIQPYPIETPYLYHALNGLGDHICSIVIEDKDGIQNVIDTIYIEPEYRNMGYAVPIYWALAKTLGFICSGEFREDDTPTSFVSPSAQKVWKRLSELAPLEKVEIRGGKKYRLCLKVNN
jgi:hypothetical protein